MKTAMIAIVAAALAWTSGCCSLATNTALRQRALRVQASEQGAAVGVDLTALGAAAEHPWLTLGAALVDGAAVYGAYAVAEHNDWFGGSDDETISVTAGGNVYIVSGGTGSLGVDNSNREELR